jgi:DNA polymerase-3 subunit alpha
MSPFLKYLPSDRVPLIELPEQLDGAIVKVCGVIMTVRKILTKKNQNMAFVAIEDETGPSELVVFPKIWDASESTLVEGAAIYVEGKVSKKEGRDGGEVLESKVLADRVVTISEQEGVPENQVTQLILTIPEDGDRDLLQRIKTYLEQHPGRIPVTLLLPTMEGTQELKITQRVKFSDELFGKLINLLGRDRIQL